MDKMDRLLQQLPSEPVPPGLALQICITIRARRQRWLAVRLAFSSVLGMLGGWLLLPILAFWSQSLGQPPNGWVVLQDWLGIALQDMGLLLQAGLDTLLTIQSGMAPGNGNALPGLVALGLSALILLDILLPHEEWI